MSSFWPCECPVIPLDFRIHLSYETKCLGISEDFVCTLVTGLGVILLTSVTNISMAQDRKLTECILTSSSRDQDCISLTSKSSRLTPYP